MGRQIKADKSERPWLYGQDRRRWHRDPAEEERREQVYRDELASYLADEKPCKGCGKWACPTCYVLEGEKDDPHGVSLGYFPLPIGDVTCRVCTGTQLVQLRDVLEDFGQPHYDHLCAECAEWESWRD